MLWTVKVPNNVTEMINSLLYNLIPGAICYGVYSQYVFTFFLWIFAMMAASVAARKLKLLMMQPTIKCLLYFKCFVFVYELVILQHSFSARHTHTHTFCLSLYTTPTPLKAMCY